MLESKKANWQWRYIQQVLRLASPFQTYQINYKNPQIKGRVGATTNDVGLSE